MAFFEEAARPASVRGPVLFWELFLLAAVLASTSSFFSGAPFVGEASWFGFVGWGGADCSRDTESVSFKAGSWFARTSSLVTVPGVSGTFEDKSDIAKTFHQWIGGSDSPPTTILGQALGWTAAGEN